MPISGSRRTTGIYDDPHLQALAFEAAAAEAPISALELFGLAPTVPQQPAIPPALLQLAHLAALDRPDLMQLARDQVDVEPLPDARGNIPGTSIPDFGVPEDATQYLGQPPRSYDFRIRKWPPGGVPKSLPPRLR